MNYLVYLTLLNLILISRLRLLFKDEGADKKDAFIMGLFPCLLIPFLQVNAGWFFLLAWLLVYPWIFLKTEQFTQKQNRNRMYLLGIHFLVIGILCSPFFSLSFNNFSSNITGALQRLFLIEAVGRDAWLSFHVVVFGLLMSINEANILLRYLLEVFRLKPIAEKGSETDEKEYNTGRLIGILERIFVFVFVLLGQYTAIGFILAAKGVARFQDFKSRTFAEYVLIGTLLSTLLAMVLGYFVLLLS